MVITKTKLWDERPDITLTLASFSITKPYEQPDITTGKLYRGIRTTNSTTLASLFWPEMFQAGSFTKTPRQKVCPYGANQRVKTWLGK